jgi:hypothetical protein
MTAAPASSIARGPRLRIDDIELLLARDGTLGIRAEGNVTAAAPVMLPAFQGWLAAGTLRMTLRGRSAAPLELALAVEGAAHGQPVRVEPVADAEVGHGAFSAELSMPLGGLRGSLGEALQVAVMVWTPAAPTAPPRHVGLFWLTLVAMDGPGPLIQALEVSDATARELYGGAERRSFDLQNPEEGFWKSSGKALLSLSLRWANAEGTGYAVDRRLERLTHAFKNSGALVEDTGRRSSEGDTTRGELLLDTGHVELGAIPEEGKSIALDLEGTHVLSFQHTPPGASTIARRALAVWRSASPVRLRDPRPLLKTFQRASAVGIDFGTSSTVAALVERGYRSLLQLGRPTLESRGDEELARAAENPAVLLVDDHERLWTEMAGGSRFPHLVRVLRGSHAALERAAEAPNAVIGQLKTLPDRVLGLDESPQLRDRERQRDFLLDETRVRALVRAYAYLLGRAINGPGQEVHLHYVMTHPSKGDAKIRKLIEDEVRAGLLLSIPEDIAAEELRFEVVATEAEAFAAEVCPELCAHPDVVPLLEKHGELRFVVFDLGGGTLDLACGRFRPATEAEQAEHGSSTVIETLQVNGQPDLGGEFLTHELAWIVHQHAAVLPEMEQKEVPMMRPATVPVNHLARRPELYKRSLAGRQNWLRMERALGLERVKFGPNESPRPAPGLTLTRIDGSDAKVDALGGDLEPVAVSLRQHLAARIAEGTKLLASTLGSTQWPADANGGTDAQAFLDRGIVVLLAGNSSRSAFVAQAVAEELGLAGEGAFQPWRPAASGGALRNIVLYETPPRTERGVTIVGVTPKTAVALGALKLANHEVHLVRATQGFGYFLGDLRGFPPKFVALVPMGAPSGPAEQPGPHLFDFGRWDSKMPLRVAREYVPGKMTSNDPRVFLVPTGLPPGHLGRLFVAVAAPDEVVLLLDRAGGNEPEPLTTTLSLAKALR